MVVQGGTACAAAIPSTSSTAVAGGCQRVCLPGPRVQLRAAAARQRRRPPARSVYVSVCAPRNAAHDAQCSGDGCPSVQHTAQRVAVGTTAALGQLRQVRSPSSVVVVAVVVGTVVPGKQATRVGPGTSAATDPLAAAVHSRWTWQPLPGVDGRRPAEATPSNRRAVSGVWARPCRGVVQSTARAAAKQGDARARRRRCTCWGCCTPPAFPAAGIATVSEAHNQRLQRPGATAR